MNDEEKFENDCAETGKKILDTLLSQNKVVAICVLPGVLAAVMKTFDLPREMIIQMLDSALEDIGNV